jgi:hypothetical protein
MLRPHDYGRTRSSTAFHWSTAIYPPYTAAFAIKSLVGRGELYVLTSISLIPNWPPPMLNGHEASA